MQYCPSKSKIINNLFSITLLISLFTNVFSVAFAQDLKPQTFESQHFGTARITKPTKIVLVHITPKISDNNKFLQSTDILFLDYFKQMHNIFSFVAIDNQIYRIRDIDLSYALNKDEDSTVYIAYTNSVPEKLISDLMDVYSIKSIVEGVITFKKNIFNIEEGKDLFYKKSSKVDISVDNISASYQQSPDPSSQIDITVKFKNTAIYPLYKEEISRIVALSVDNNNKEIQSGMFINDVWNSKSRVGVVKEDIIRPGEIGTIEYKALSNPDAGKQTQKFTLADNDGNILPDTYFDVTFNIKDVSQKVVEAKVTNNSFINIKEKSNSSSRTIYLIETSTRFISLEESNGWTKVKFNGDKTGWIPTYYLRK